MNKPSLSNGAAFLVAIIVLLLIAICMSYETYLDHSRRTVHQMETEATRIDRALIIEIEHSSHLLQGIGQEMMHMDTDDLNAIAFLLRSFDTTATVHHVFSWIDAKNQNVVSSNKGVHPPIDVSDRDFVQKAIAIPWEIQIGAPIQGRVSAKWALPVALGITDATGKYLGTILISMDIYTLTKDLQSAVKESGIYFAIYSESLLPLTQSIDGDEIAQFDGYLGELKAVDFTKAPSGKIASASLFNKNSMYVYYEKSATYPYVIALAINHAATVKALRSLLLPRLVELLLLGFFMLALLWLIRLRIIKPIAELADITGGVLRGSPYRNPLTGNGVDELYLLAQQIRKMGDYLQEMRRIGEENRNKNAMLKQDKDKADLSNKIKMDFIASMSHELRTPLNTIIGFSEIMKNQSYGKFENKQYLQYTQDIHEAAKQLQYLVDDMHKLTHTESNAVELHEKPLDIRLILNKSLRAASRALSENKVNVELKLPEDLPHLQMDEQRMEQIITNIVSTMLRHSVPGSTITVKAFTEQAPKSGMFCITFTDSRSASESIANDNEKKPFRHETGHFGIPLTRALLAMHHAQLDIKTVTGKPTLITLRFSKERLV